MTEPTARPVWRVGTKLGRTIYLNEQCVGIVDEPHIARALVEAANGAAESELRKLREELAHAEREANERLMVACRRLGSVETDLDESRAECAKLRAVVEAAREPGLFSDAAARACALDVDRLINEAHRPDQKTSGDGTSRSVTASRESSGSEPAPGREPLEPGTCERCKGHGIWRPRDPYRAIERCPACNGTGKTPPSPVSPSAVIAQRAYGCTNCGKPAQLVGDRLLSCSLCPWCHAVAAPGANALRDAEQLKAVADKLREAVCDEDDVTDIGDLIRSVEESLSDQHEQILAAEKRAKAAEARIAELLARGSQREDELLDILAEAKKQAAEYRYMLERALPVIDPAGQLAQEIRAALSPPDLDSLAELRAWRKASEGG